MKRDSLWAIQIAKVKGIPVRIHLTFFLFLIWIAFDATERGRSPIPEVVFVTTLFVCVVLHELGHALMAKYFNIGTRDITLYPFGGVAAVLGEAKPKAELFITIAGPLVNVIIAAAIFPFIQFDEHMLEESSAGFLDRVFIANVVLVIFNLIPAYPMDGGRILRATLALMKVKSATIIAARMGQILSIALGALALYSENIILILIAVIVFSNAMQEIMRAKAKRAAAGFQVRDVMNELSTLQVLHHGMTISQALNIALKSLQNSFPVLLGDNLIGIVDRQILLQRAATDPDEAYISEVMSREFITVEPQEDLESITERVNSYPFDTLLVVDKDKLVGMMTKEKLLEFLLVHGLRKKATQTTHLMDEEF